MQSEVSMEGVNEIVTSVFGTMMDIPIWQSEIPWHPGGDRVTASVFLEGKWNGAISLECSRDQAREFAGRFLSMEPPETMDDDVRDVLGELANIIGGNIKSAMATSARLSMPSVIDGGNYEFRICGSEVQNKVAFSFSGGTFWVSLIKKGGPDGEESPGDDAFQITI
ncbi:MAG TPA: chemotaxis protein CheX [Terracidiphilus sp.]|jgi:chemotaxis protein CheX|nr:chemotaxis protein CheX [Terracidiphilus sp.]